MNLFHSPSLSPSTSTLLLTSPSRAHASHCRVEEASFPTPSPSLGPLATSCILCSREEQLWGEHLSTHCHSKSPTCLLRPGQPEQRGWITGQTFSRPPDTERQPSQRLPGSHGAAHPAAGARRPGTGLEPAPVADGRPAGAGLSGRSSWASGQGGGTDGGMSGESQLPVGGTEGERRPLCPRVPPESGRAQGSAASVGQADLGLNLWPPGPQLTIPG